MIKQFFKKTYYVEYTADCVDGRKTNGKANLFFVFFEIVTLDKIKKMIIDENNRQNNQLLENTLVIEKIVKL